MNHASMYCAGCSILLSAIYFIFPLPHTVALRNLLLLLLAGMAIILLKRKQLTVSSIGLVLRYGELRVLAILSSWLILTLLWATDRSFSLENYLSEWLGSLFVAWLGFSLARGLSKSCAGLLPAWIALALATHGIWMLTHQVMIWSQTGLYPIGQTPYGEYAILSTAINMSFALLLADVVSRWLSQQPLFPWHHRVAAVLLAIAAISVAAAKARNGVITVFALLVVTTLVSMWQQRSQLPYRRHISTALVVMFVALGLISLNIASDERWGRFMETVSVALDTETNNNWLYGNESNVPAISGSQAAESSAYMRIAWAKVAIEGIAHKPLGYGYGLGGFGRYLEEVYGRTGAVSSHSGILDFTLANGVPGLVLLLAFVALLFRRGWLSWVSGNPWGLALMLSLTNYFVRIILDGHFGGFRLKMIALLLGILYWLALNQPDADDA